MGPQYTPYGFTTSTKKFKLTETPSAYLLQDGHLALVFTMEWLSAYGNEQLGMFAVGPYSGTGLNAFKEHEQEDPPHVKLTRSGDISIYFP